MRSTHLLHLAILASLALPASAFANAKQSSKKPTARNEPQGFILIEEDVAFDMQNMPQVFLSDARQDFRNRNYGDAAGDVRAASRLINSEAKNTKNADARGELMIEEHQLDGIQKDLRDNRIASADELDNRLADASVHEANHFRQNAEMAWKNRQYRRAGHEMNLAQNAIERAGDWIAETGKRSGTDLDKGIHKVGDELVAGTGWTAREVQKAMGDLGSSIKGLSNDVEAKIRTAANRTNNGSTSGTTSSVNEPAAASAPAR